MARSMLLHLVMWWLNSNVSEDGAASFFRVDFGCSDSPKLCPANCCSPFVHTVVPSNLHIAFYRLFTSFSLLSWYYNIFDTFIFMPVSILLSWLFSLFFFLVNLLFTFCHLYFSLLLCSYFFFNIFLFFHLLLLPYFLLHCLHLLPFLTRIRLLLSLHLWHFLSLFTSMSHPLSPLLFPFIFYPPVCHVVCVPVTTVWRFLGLRMEKTASRCGG